MTKNRSTMKIRTLFLILITVCMLTACENENSVNILISNKSGQPVSNRTVTVQLDTIRQWLHTDKSDTLILLNEKNQPLPYTYNTTHSAITFRVPTIQPNSQKNFTINKSDVQLSENILAFRRKNIEIVLE